eukprot:GHVQ01041326.1.p1 GENE.GHVQ01041326.1~~GHVQ01041326.1.p1  ORF type:complete len:163 (+),score=21.02 GHVQ01041326.1:58-546(+)
MTMTTEGNHWNIGLLQAVSLLLVKSIFCCSSFAKERNKQYDTTKSICSSMSSNNSNGRIKCYGKTESYKHGLCCTDYHCRCNDYRRMCSVCNLSLWRNGCGMTMVVFVLLCIHLADALTFSKTKVCTESGKYEVGDSNRQTCKDLFTGTVDIRNQEVCRTVL